MINSSLTPLQLNHDHHSTTRVLFQLNGCQLTLKKKGGVSIKGIHNLILLHFGFGQQKTQVIGCKQVSYLLFGVEIIKCFYPSFYQKIHLTSTSLVNYRCLDICFGETYELSATRPNVVISLDAFHFS
jgi:hypothetical protein